MIKTADCVNKINETCFKGKWKRTAKYRTDSVYIYNETHQNLKEDNFDVLYLREFVCKEHPTKIAFVYATEEKVILVKVLEPVPNAKAFILHEPEEDPIYGKNWSSEDVDLDSIATTPYLKLSKTDSAYDVNDLENNYESQDFENWTIVEITDYTIKLVFGGDWQDPISCVFRYMSDNKFYFDSTTITKQETF